MAAPGLGMEPGMEQEPGGEQDMEPEPEPEPEVVTAEAVLRELRLFELRCEGEDVSDKLVELCLTHGLGPVALANELLAFVTSKDLDPLLTLDGLDTFEHEVLARRSSRGRSRRDEPQRDPHDLQSLQGLLDEEEEDELLDSYSTPCKGPPKRRGSPPDPPRAKRAPPPSRSPFSMFSPGSFSPGATPSPKYSSRGGRGEVVASFGATEGLSWRGRGGVGVTPRPFGDPAETLRGPYKFMFQKALDVREALASRMELLGEALRQHHGLEGFAPAALPAQEPVPLLGRVCCDGNGRLNPRSVLLEGPGGDVPLDLSQLQEYSLFPGQIVALEGTNSTGKRILVTKLYEGVPLPFHSPPEPPSEPLLVLVACGPFTPSDSVAFDPLSDLLGVLGRDQPDLCVLLGPFLDAKNEQVESCHLRGSFSDVFRLCLRTILEGTRSSGCPLVLVPSLRDVSHIPVFPQSPFLFPELPKEDRARLLLVPEPCTLDVSGVVLGLSSTDVLFHVGSEEISSSSGISDRFTRILRHLLTQRSYYPLYPPSEELSVDHEHLALFGSLPVTPDVLVTPSDLRFFIKDVLGCVCINPGRLTKGRAGGTFCRLLLHREAPPEPPEPPEPPRGRNSRNSPCVAAQIVRI